MKVIINQISIRYKIYIDGRLTPMEDVAKQCNVTMQRFRRSLSHDDRELEVLEWILKAKHKVHPSCKTFWNNGIPMWQSLVVRITGVSVSTAFKRVNRWMIDDDMTQLMQGHTDDIPCQELPTTKLKGDWGLLSDKSRSDNLKHIPCTTEFERSL